MEPTMKTNISIAKAFDIPLAPFDQDIRYLTGIRYRLCSLGYFVMDSFEDEFSTAILKESHVVEGKSKFSYHHSFYGALISLLQLQPEMDFQLHKVTTLSDVVAFTYHLLDKRFLLGEGCFSDYVNIDKKSPSLTPLEVEKLNRMMEECVEVCEEMDVDFWDICLELEKVHPNFSHSIVTETGR